MKINEALKREAEFAAAVFEEEELERFRSARSFVYRNGPAVSLGCLVAFMVGLFMTLVFRSGAMLWVFIGIMGLAATILVYTLLRIIRPEDSTRKVLGRLALYYIAISALMAIISIIR